MSKTPDATKARPIPRGRTPTRTEPPAVPRARARWWLLAVGIGLLTASEVGLILAVGARLRRMSAAASPGGPARARGVDVVHGTQAEAAPSIRTPATELPVPAPDPGRLAGRAADPPASQPLPDGAPPPAAGLPESPRPAADAADRHPRVSMLSGEPRPGLPRPVADAAGPPAEAVRSLGAELFAREWLPNDLRCHGGDGLGPVYNASSCLDCHNQGGSGGAGPAAQNVELATGIGYIPPAEDPGIPSNLFGAEGGIGRPIVTARPVQADLVEAHPGFRDGRSIVLHRFGVDAEYGRWRADFRSRSRPAPVIATSSPGPRSRRHPTSRTSTFDEALGAAPAMADWLTAVCKQAADQLGMTRVAISLTERNTPALFGTGLIDGVSERDLEGVARHQPPEIRGRVHRLKDGRIGRFGWKAQVASLEDFVLTACANELGLEVPGHHQAVSPLDRDATARGLDLTRDECDALVDYVRNLPPPASLAAPGPGGPTLAEIAEGRLLFQSMGCATCHTPDLGPAHGIYSDLLLHDMGERLSDPGDYYADDSDSPGAAKRGEWRTPPLWGLRDSGPYLHDGRAQDLDQAVALHGGQGAASSQRFRLLSPLQHSQLEAFLNSLVAPTLDGPPGFLRKAEHAPRSKAPPRA